MDVDVDCGGEEVEGEITQFVYIALKTTYLFESEKS